VGVFFWYTVPVEFFKKYQRWFFVLGLLLATALVWGVIWGKNRPGTLAVSLLNVGAGEAIFIQAPSGKTVLVDGGSDATVLRRLGEVMPWYERSIDLVVLTSPKKEYVAGLADVLSRYRIGKIIYSGAMSNLPEYEVVRKLMLEKKIPELLVRRGDVVNLGKGVSLSVLLPYKDVSNTDAYDGSLAMKLIYGKTSFLIPGAIKENLESYLVVSDADYLASDVLIAANPNSPASNSEQFLSAVKPKLALISAAPAGKYPTISSELLNRFSQSAIPVLRTDDQGTITIRSDGVTIRSGKRR
jgi:competence protein ComEC